MLHPENGVTASKALSHGGSRASLILLTLCRISSSVMKLGTDSGLSKGLDDRIYKCAALDPPPEQKRALHDDE